MEIRPEFQFHKLNAEGIASAQDIAYLFTELLNALEPYIGAGREAAIVRTKLEEASFFAKKGMATQKGNQA
jgi:hypothetical protein